MDITDFQVKDVYTVGARMVTKSLRALAALPQNLDSIPSTYLEAHHHL